VNFHGVSPNTYAFYKTTGLLGDETLPELYLGPFTISGGRFPYVYSVEPDHA
jgi:hypothetical protein